MAHSSAATGCSLKLPASLQRACLLQSKSCPVPVAARPSVVGPHPDEHSTAALTCVWRRLLLSACKHAQPGRSSKLLFLAPSVCSAASSLSVCLQPSIAPQSASDLGAPTVTPAAPVPLVSPAPPSTVTVGAPSCKSKCLQLAAASAVVGAARHGGASPHTSNTSLPVTALRGMQLCAAASSSQPSRVASSFCPGRAAIVQPCASTDEPLMTATACSIRLPCS